MDKSATMSAWIAEEVKNWTQALLNLTQTIAIAPTNQGRQATLEAIGEDTADEIIKRIRSLLGIANDK